MKPLRKYANRLGFGFAVYITAYIVGIVIMSIVVQNYFPDLTCNTWYFWALNSAPNYFFGMPIFFFITRKVPDSPVPEPKSISIKSLFRYTIMSLSIAYIFSFVGNLFNLFFVEHYGISENIVQDVLESCSTMMAFLFIVIIAPIAEEWIFRRRFLTKTLVFGRKKAVLAGGLAFGLFHLNIPQFAYAFALGTFWGVLFIKYGRVTPVILLHMIVNALGSIVFPRFLLINAEVFAIIGGAFILVVSIVGMVWLSKEKNALLTVLQDPVEHAESETEQIEEKPIKTPSLIFNPGFILYMVIIVLIFTASLFGAAALERAVTL